MSSYGEYTIQGEGLVYSAWLGLTGVVETRITCTRYQDSTMRLADEVNRKPECYASIIPLRIAKTVGLEALLAAQYSAYLAYLRGRSVARRKGLDTLLYLAGERNIGKALAVSAPREGETVLLLVTPSTCDAGEVPYAGSCTVPASSRESVSRTALAVVDMRLYKPPRR